MNTVKSGDGTTIAYERSGQGRPLIVVGGAFSERSTFAALANALESNFTVFTYDRRARGDSGDTAPYAIEREIEDLDAIIVVAGEPAYVFGHSSGAVLAMMAARAGSSIAKLALYEPAYPLDDGSWATMDLPERLTELIEGGLPGDAVALFQAHVGLPPEAIAQIRLAPFWPALVKIAQSTVYDATITRLGALRVDELRTIATPALVLLGAETWPILRRSAQTVAAGLGDAEYRELPGGENHGMDPALVAKELTAFFSRPDLEQTPDLQPAQM
jgi:pimeloyl-ACP methyl ester carboxylesterase